jgi:hypothetical protein
MEDSSGMKQSRQRWQAVEEIERQEAQAATYAERWQQLNSLLRLAGSLNLPLEPDADDMRVIERWNKLRAGYERR